MRQLKKTVVLAVLAVVMTMMVSVSVKAGRINTPTNVVWGQSFSGYVIKYRRIFHFKVAL